MTRITWRRELAWAIGFLGLAVLLGFMFHWPLVQASLRGNLTALLDQKRQVGLESILEDALLLGVAGWLYWRECKIGDREEGSLSPVQSKL